MKFKDTLVGMMGDFVGMSKTPDFKSSSSTAASREDLSHLAVPGAGAGARRHSLNITVGAEEVPVCPVKPGRTRAESICVMNPPQKAVPAGNTRRMSLPITNTNNSSMRKKMQKKKGESSSDRSDSDSDEGFHSVPVIKEEDEPCPAPETRRASVYRI